MDAPADSARPLFPRWLPALAALIAAGGLLWLLRTVLTPVLGGFLIAYILDPIVDRLERWRIPRALGIALVLAGALALLGLVLLLVLPGVVREFGQFAQELPRHAANLMRRLEPWLANRGIEAPHSLREVIDQLGVDFRSVASRAAAPAGQILGYLAGGTASLVGALASLVVIPVFAFYLLYDFDRLTAGARELVPWRVRPFAMDLAREVDAVLGQFVRGQLLIMLLLAVLYSVAYSLLGVRLAVPIGLVAGLLSFIPYVGGATALGLALLMCALAGASWSQVGGVVAAYAVIQSLEGFVITPRIMEEKVGLSAIWVLLALMVFGELFGFFGVLLAVPAAAVAKIFVLRAVAHYRHSELFLRGSPSESAAMATAAEGLLDEEGLADDDATRRAKAEARRANRAGRSNGPRATAGPSKPTAEPPVPSPEPETPTSKPPVARAEPERPTAEPPARAAPTTRRAAERRQPKSPPAAGTRASTEAPTGEAAPEPTADRVESGTGRRPRKRRRTGRRDID